MHKPVGGIIIAVSAAFLFAGGMSTADDTAAKVIDLKTDNVRVTLGPQITLLGEGSFGMHYFIDERLVVLQRRPVFRALVTAAIETYLVEGESIGKITGARKVLSKGGKGEIDNGYIGASGGYRLKNGVWCVLCHVEDQEDMPAIGGGIPGFYARVVLATSRDGTSWTKEGAVITSSKPKEFTMYDGQADRGAAEPGLVADRNGRWLYAYYTEHSRQNGRGVQICMARADLKAGIPGPGKWFKYHEGEFDQPGIGGLDTPVISAQKYDQAEAMYPHVEYSKAFGKYIMILCVNYWKEYYYNKGLSNSGLYIAFSDDAINWSEPEKIVTDFVVPLIGKSLTWQGTLVFDEGSSTGGWLVYGYSPSWGHLGSGGTPHYLAGRRILLEKKAGK